MAAWLPVTFDEACKRNAGRRKLHMQKRKARADRIVRVLAATDSAHATELRKSAYGRISLASRTMQVSKATASRDFTLVRRIHWQFLRMFRRNFDAKSDRVVWTWNWGHYGFITSESRATGHRKPVGHSSIVMTLDTYSHVLPSMQQAATEKLEKMLFGKAGTL